MTIPLQLPQINPGIGGSGIAPQNPLGDAGAAFVQALLASQGNSLRRTEEQGRNSRSSVEAGLEQGRLAIQKAEMDFRIAQEKTKQQNAKVQGDALKQLLPVFLQMGGGAQMFGQQGAPGPTMGQGDQGAAPQPSVAPTSPPAPMAAFAGAVQQLPSEVVPGFVNDYSKLATDAQGKADRLQAIERSVSAIKDPAQQQGARALLTFAELGANLPKELQATIFPQLFPKGEAVDPQAMNAASTLFKTGLFTWGQARRQAGVPSMPGVPDDVKFNPFPTRPRQDQFKAGAMLSVMQSATPIIDKYSQKQAPGPLASWIKGGGKGSFRELLGNPLLSVEDRAFVQASRQFADAWAYVISGAATADAQFARIFGSITENFGDDPGTRQQKRNMRQIMLQSISDIAGGTVTPTQVLDRTLKLDWSPELKKFLQEERGKAAKYETEVKAGKTSINTTTPAPTTPEDFEEQMAEIIAAMRRDP